jgi:hypothetical protein
MPGEPNPTNGAMIASFFQNSNSAYNVLYFKTCNTLFFSTDNSTLAQRKHGKVIPTRQRHWFFQL